MANNLGLYVMATPSFQAATAIESSLSIPRAVGLFVILNSNSEFERL
jgi:hypothetical protein